MNINGNALSATSETFQMPMCKIYEKYCKKMPRGQSRTPFNDFQRKLCYIRTFQILLIHFESFQDVSTTRKWMKMDQHGSPFEYIWITIAIPHLPPIRYRAWDMPQRSSKIFKGSWRALKDSEGFHTILETLMYIHFLEQPRIAPTVLPEPAVLLLLSQRTFYCRSCSAAIWYGFMGDV